VAVPRTKTGGVGDGRLLTQTIELRCPPDPTKELKVVGTGIIEPREEQHTVLSGGTLRAVFLSIE